MAGAVRRLRAHRGHDRLLRSGPGRFVLLVVVSVLGIATAILWRDNREMARRIRILEGAERIMNMRMLEIQEERLRLERLQYFLP